MPLAQTKCRSSLRSDEAVFAVHVAIPAARRKSLANRKTAAYSAPIDSNHPVRRKDRTMNATYTTPATARIAAFVAAVLTSVVVLGSTVAGMQPRDDASASLVALQRANAIAVR
jgi:hypothetical protein